VDHDRTERSRGHRRRAGFILPFVVVAAALVAVLGFTAITTSWRAVRAARLAASGVRAQFAADEGLALQLNAWPAESLTSLPLGTTYTSRLTTQIGDPIAVRITRTHPLVAWVSAEVALKSSGSVAVVQRQVTRVVSLDPPPLPIIGALTAIGAVHATDLTAMTGHDHADAGDACGPLRDTRTVPPIAAAMVSAPAHAERGEPPFLRLSDTTRVRAAFETAWPAIVARSAVRGAEGNAGGLAQMPGWHALVLSGPQAAVQSSGRWRGLLAVSGDLVVGGSLDVEGVLVVRGRLDARRASLRVRGAVVIASHGNPEVELGDHTRIQFDRCAVLMAMATVALPRSSPFFLWVHPAL